MRRILLLLPAALLLVAGCESSTPTPYKPIVDNLTLMQTVVDPQADILWASVGSIITAEGSEDFFPRNEAEWAEVLNASVMIMESGNLLMMGDRAIDDGDWMVMAGDLVDAGKLAYDAAEAQDPDAIFAIGADVYDACNRCHEKYWVGDRERYPGNDGPAEAGL